MKAVAKALAWAVLLTAIVWAAVTLYWSRTHRAITQADVVLGLVALPMLVVTGFFLLRWAWRGAAAKSAARTAQTAALASTTSAASASVPHPVADERRWAFQLIAQWVHTAAGSDTAAVWTAVRDAEVRPQPDPDLRDDDGQAIFTTRAPDIDVPALRVALVELPINPAIRQVPSPRLLRTLCLLQGWRERLDNSLSIWADTQRTQTTALTIAMLLPATDRVQQPIDNDEAPPSPDLAWARAWLASQLGQLDAFDPRRHQVIVRAARHGADVVAWADQHLLAWQRAQRTGLLLLLVADSLIDHDLAAERSRRAELMHGRNPKGATLGEAAVGLLLATHDWPAPSQHAHAERDHPPVLLHRWTQRRRDQSADAGGRVKPDVACDALGDALLTSAVPGETVQAAVSDTDLRPSRTTEWYGALLQHAGHLDTGQDVLSLGVALGDCGVAQAALCVALAAHRAATEQQAVVAATVSTPLDRGAVVLQPLQPQPVATEHALAA